MTSKSCGSSWDRDTLSCQLKPDNHLPYPSNQNQRPHWSGSDFPKVYLYIAVYGEFDLFIPTIFDT